MSNKDELRKIEEYIERLYEEGKTTTQIKKELITKGAPNEIIDQLISLTNKDDPLDKTDKFEISGESLNKLKELLLNKFDTKYFYKKVYSNNYQLKQGEMFVFVIEYFWWFVSQTLSATILCEFINNKCLITLIPTGGKVGWLKISWGSESVLSDKLADFLKKVSEKNNWRFEQTKFREKFTFDEEEK